MVPWSEACRWDECKEDAPPEACMAIWVRIMTLAAVSLLEACQAHTEYHNGYLTVMQAARIAWKDERGSPGVVGL